ncbi:MAG: prolyl oligopeptidase family serine peptidase, partial [Clostridia bacterium]|nr:prolyl oligopeptidase family serine peptidase [Clostridia bacterium]
IDPERVTAYGTSSGGNTALLLGLTGDDPRYKTDEYADYSDAVSAVAECFGPTDMFDLNNYHTGGTGTLDLVQKLLGDPESEEAQALARDMSPLFLVKDGVSYPPVMILHGDADRTVPYESQGVRMADRLDEAGCDVTLIRVEGADHEGDFWSDELHDLVLEFIDRHMKK